jgi:hypothetical protein
MRLGALLPFLPSDANGLAIPYSSSYLLISPYDSM